MPGILLLDLDGTLIDSVPDLLASCDRLMVPRGHAPFTRPEITAMVGDGAAALVHRMMAARGEETTPADLATFLDDYTAHAADETAAFPGVAETLDRLAGRGWRMAVCTNKPGAATRAILSKLGLLGYFAAVGAGDSFPVRKPDPAHLLATLAEAGASAESAVMAGDHHNDVASAQGAGVPCIFAAWGYGPMSMSAGAQGVAEAFSDLPEIAERLLMARA